MPPTFEESAGVDGSMGHNIRPCAAPVAVQALHKLQLCTNIVADWTNVAVRLDANQEIRHRPVIHQALTDKEPNRTARLDLSGHEGQVLRPKLPERIGHGVRLVHQAGLDKIEVENAVKCLQV